MARKSKKLLQRIRVPLGFIFAAVFLVFAEPTPVLIGIGSCVALVGLAIRGWASGHIRKNRNLAVSGPYSFTRNPLYLGSFILGVGIGIASGRWWLVLLFTILFMGIYLPVMSVEAEELTDIFGEEYRKYASSVPLFFPWFGKLSGSKQQFELQLYLGYREYRALLGFLGIVAVLFAKFWFLNN